MIGQTLFPSSARKGTQTTADVQSAVEDRGLMLVLDITKAPNNEETLTLAIEVKDQASSKYIPLTAFAASKKGSELGSGATLVYTINSGGVETSAVGNHEVQALPLPRYWRVKITHSAAVGEWTYSLGAQPVG